MIQLVSLRDDKYWPSALTVNTIGGHRSQICSPRAYLDSIYALDIRAMLQVEDSRGVTLAEVKFFRVNIDQPNLVLNIDGSDRRSKS